MLYAAESSKPYSMLSYPCSQQQLEDNIQVLLTSIPSEEL
jgi:hypothetical protein